jgi:hypothetical protein
VNALEPSSGPRPRLDARAFAATATLVLHALVLFALLHVTASVVPPPAPTAPVSADRLRDAGEQLVSVDLGPGLSADGLACTGSTYVGVGVTADPRTERLILIGDNTPASRAGLQHDDIVLNPEVWRDAHQDGAVLRMLILREGVKMIVAVRVGRICIE